jgi:flagellar hook-associated protein 3 FlgL
MRITQNMLGDSTVRNLNQIMSRMDELQDELTSGKVLRRPSDDPVAITRSLQCRADLAGIDQYLRNKDSAKSWLTAADGALDGVDSALTRAKELAVQGANSSYSAEDRKGMANEVTELIDEVVQLANTKYGDQYIFGGHQTLAPPMNVTGSTVTYDGDDGAIAREVAKSSSVTINLTGDDTFVPALNSLVALRDALQTNDVSAVDAAGTPLDAALDVAVSRRATVGARINRVDQLADQLEGMKIDMKDLLSRTEDLDIAEASVDYASQEAVYNAALAASAKFIQPTLISYLR